METDFLKNSETCEECQGENCTIARAAAWAVEAICDHKRNKGDKLPKKRKGYETPKMAGYNDERRQNRKVVVLKPYPCPVKGSLL
jgi:hypothetical protein